MHHGHCDTDGENSTNVLLSDLIYKASKRTTSKVNQTTMRIVAEFFNKYLERDQANLLQEMVEFHSMMVNPAELVVSTEFLKALTNEEHLVGAPFLKMYILFSQYTKDKRRNYTKRPRTRTVPRSYEHR